MSDKRYAPRTGVKLSMLVKNPLSRDDIFALEVQSCDISPKGVRIVSPQMLQPNAHVELVVKRGPNDEVRLSGRIIWVKKSDNDTWQAGIAFYSPRPDF
jgi:hypothetical protein